MKTKTVKVTLTISAIVSVPDNININTIIDKIKSQLSVNHFGNEISVNIIDDPEFAHIIMTETTLSSINEIP
jgi:hypothetical protein